MLKGLLAGLGWGVLLSAVGMTALSLATRSLDTVRRDVALDASPQQAAESAAAQSGPAGVTSPQQAAAPEVGVDAPQTPAARADPDAVVADGPVDAGSAAPVTGQAPVEPDPSERAAQAGSDTQDGAEIAEAAAEGASADVPETAEAREERAPSAAVEVASGREVELIQPRRPASDAPVLEGRVPSPANPPVVLQGSTLRDARVGAGAPEAPARAPEIISRAAPQTSMPSTPDVPMRAPVRDSRAPEYAAPSLRESDRPRLPRPEPVGVVPPVAVPPGPVGSVVVDRAPAVAVLSQLPNEIVIPSTPAPPQASIPQPPSASRPVLDEAPSGGSSDGPRIIAPVPDAAPNAPRRPQPGFGNRDADAPRSGRLPTIGATEPDAAADRRAEAPPAVRNAPAAVVAEADGAAPALLRNARPFEPVGNLPPMVLLLLDDGSMAVSQVVEALGEQTVTVVLDPRAPDLAGRATAWAGAGHEVTLSADVLPVGGTGSDMEVTLEALVRDLPQLLGLVGTPAGGFQDDRAALQAGLPGFASRGLGLAIWGRGLNQAEQAARRAGVPVVRIGRSLDADGDSAEAIRRYLDREAFRAQQEGQVVLHARARPETLQALAEWRQTARARQVVFAPLSVLLLPQLGAGP